jgi:hypothetical protein
MMKSDELGENFSLGSPETESFLSAERFLLAAFYHDSLY